MKDWRGTEIKIGSTIVYAVTQSSSVTMVEATVDEISEETIDRGYWKYEKGGTFAFILDSEGRKIWEPNLVPKFTIKATRKETTGWNHGKVKPKQVTLTAIERIVVIPEIVYNEQSYHYDPNIDYMPNEYEERLNHP